MAKYFGTDGKKHKLNLLSYEWKLMGKEEDYIIVYTPNELAQEVFKYDEALIDENNPFYWLKINYHYATDDVLGFNPICDCLQYSIGDRVVIIETSKKEFTYFRQMLIEAIGDKHSSEMQKTMVNYHNSVDKEILYFVKDICSGREVSSITVGFVSETMASDIFKLTGLNVTGNRIRLDESAVRHIINRHGASGVADSSMKDNEDIARMSYVLSNYDKIEWNGGTTSRLSTKNNTGAPCIKVTKRINGTYYVIEAISDSKKAICSIVSAYLTKYQN